jgi:SAM-dependent methyltransferase
MRRLPGRRVADYTLELQREPWGSPAMTMRPYQVSEFARQIEPLLVSSPPRKAALADCAFYHFMDLPGVGQVGHEWDLRPNVDAYLGNLDFRGKRVLEIGPASGFLTFTMEQKGASVVAVELTQAKAWEFVPFPREMMDPIIAKRRDGLPRMINGFWFAHSALGSRAQVHYGDVYNIPDELGQFDVATMASVLLHCQNPVRIIEQCAQRAQTLLIVERFFPDIEGTPICRLVPSHENGEWGTWWDFTTQFFDRYLRVLGFGQITMNRHVQMHRGSAPYELFTLVASR